jgi:hypothetical protein
MKYTLNVRAVEKGMCLVSIGSTQAIPQSSDEFFRILEQLGWGPFPVAALRKEYEANRRLHLREIELDEAGLRLIGLAR